MSEAFRPYQVAATALVVVPVASALRELGFAETVPGGAVLACMQPQAQSAGNLHLVAGPDLFGHWQVQAVAVGRRQIVLDERVLPPSAPLGQIALMLRSMGATWAGQAIAPHAQGLALAYERHRRDMRQVLTGGLQVDGPALRWLLGQWRQRAGHSVGASRVSLQQSRGMLQLERDGLVHGLPATGVLVDACDVCASSLLSLPVQRLRGHVIRVVQTPDALSFNGIAVPVLATSTSAGSGSVRRPGDA